MKKLLKKITASVMCAVMMIPLCVQAYSPGETEYTFDFSNVTDTQKASVTKTGVVLEAGGSVSFDVLLPFDAAFMDIKYKANSDAVLDIKTTRNDYSAQLSAKENNISVELMNDRSGEQELTFTANAGITIENVVFKKVDVEYPPSNTSPLKLSAYNEALYTTVAIRENAVVLYDKGAMRYLDFDKTRTTPKYFNGSLYVPAFALARALDMYIEDYQDMEYLFLRNEDESLELFAEKDECYIRQNAVKTEIENPVVYHNQITWLPVRQISELAGKTVVYKNGLCVIDDKVSANKVINDAGVYSYITGSFEKYIKEDNSGATVYHVSQGISANDHNQGTEQRPFRTIQKAAEVAEAGDTVIIHEGIYNEIVTPKNDGTPSKPIIFKAAEGEEVSVSTMKEISGFVKYNDKLYCIDIPENIGKYRMQVFYEGDYLREGRHPNEHNQPKAVDYFDTIDHDLFATHGDIFIRENMTIAEARANAGNFRARSEAGLLDQDEPDYWKGATLTTLKGAGWIVGTAKVKGSEKGSVLLDDGGNMYGSIVYFEQAFEQDWGYLSNHINCVDLPGEWYYDGKTLFIIPPEGVAGEDLKVSVKQGFTTFDLRDRKCIQIVGINTRGGGVTMTGDTEHNILNGGKHEYICHYTYTANGGGINGYNASTEVEEDDAYKGAYGMIMQGSNNAIINTLIYGSAGNAIHMGNSAYNFIYNNEISNCGYGVGDGVITVRGLKKYDEAETGGHQLINNTVHGTGGHALTVGNDNVPGDNDTLKAGGQIPIEIAYNDMYDATQYTRDAGVMYMHYGHYGNDREFSRVHHNVVHDSGVTRTGGTSINAIYFDNMASGVECHNNLLYWKRSLHPLVPVYIQRKSIFPETFSVVPNYSNKSLGCVEEDVDTADLMKMPNGKPFFAGADYGKERFMDNYNSVKEDYDSIYAEDALLENGAVIDDEGFAAFNKTGKITFKNVDLTDKNQITAYFAGEEKIGSYVVKAEIIKDGKVVEFQPITAMINSRNPIASNEASMIMQKMDGVYDVAFSVFNQDEPCDDLRLIRMRADYTDAEPPAPIGSTLVYGGAFTDYVVHTPSQPGPFSNYDISRYADYSHNYASWIFENTLIYEDVELTRDYTDFLLYAMRTAPSEGYYMQVRIGSETAEPILEMAMDFEPPNEGGHPVLGWHYIKESCKLKEPLKAGTYDFYVTFESRIPENWWLSLDLQYFAFYNEADQN